MVEEKLNLIVTAATEALAELPAELEAKRAEGYAQRAAEDGTSDKIYSQAQLDEKLAEQAVAHEAEKAELQSQIAAFPEQLIAAKAEGAAEKLAEIKANWEASQSAENAAESAFGATLV